LRIQRDALIGKRACLDRHQVEASSAALRARFCDATGRLLIGRLSQYGDKVDISLAGTAVPSA